MKTSNSARSSTPRSTRRSSWRRRRRSRPWRTHGRMSTLAETQVGAQPKTRELSYREAIRLALEHEMEQDPTVLLLGEDIGDAGGPFKTSEGLLKRFGSNRVFDTPIAENCFIGVGIGMALTGFRPAVEIMFAAFLALAFDAVVNEAPECRHMSRGTRGVRT